MQTAILSDHVPAPRGFYSQAVRAGQFIFVSGQLPVDADGNLVGTTIEAQTEHVLGNIRDILEAGGASVSHLVQVTIYISDIALWPRVNQVYQFFLQALPVPPSRVIVPVKDLHYGALIEAQATAFVA